jgi:hypothetical protein
VKPVSFTSCASRTIVRMSHTLARPKVVNTRVSPELLERASARAQAEDRSISNLVRRALSQYLDPDNGTTRPQPPNTDARDR